MAAMDRILDPMVVNGCVERVPLQTTGVMPSVRGTEPQ